jgi:hypothetical protein
VAVSYRKCPKCGHERAAADAAPADACPACGLIFEKYLRTRLAASVPPPVAADPGAPRAPSLFERAKDLLLFVPDKVEPLHVYARAALLAILIIYGIRLAAMDVPSWEMGSSLIHAPMVPIHEFGHILFRPFGEFMTNLGGALFQAALPLVFGGIFLVKNRDPFAAAAMLWWSAVAVMDTAPYVYDAQQPQHILLTGRTGDTGAHDFIDVLGDLGLLTRARSVGYAVHAFGVVMLLASFAWAAAAVWMQLRRRG